MEDVNISKYRASVVRDGSKPASPGYVVSEGQNPTDPAGSGQNHLPVTITPTATGLSITENQVLGGAGTVGQYIRGDGSLADFPQASGGGSSVSYYLNGSVNQGTIGGVAYRELSKVPILGAGTDFTINADGYIASFITDAGDPNLLEIPGGNWNFETYFSASSSGGTPTFYVELYKYDGTTFTLIASSSSAPELIAFGTSLNPYFSSLAVPTTTLALTDRLAVRYYVTHSGRTITLHTENNHLCQVITTFTTGLTSLNGLTAQVQNLAVGTSGTDFNIVSATATHTFNLPTASATNRGALSAADWTTFNNKQNAGNYVTTDTSQLISGLKTFNVNTLMMQSSGNANAVYLSNSSGSSTYQSGFNFFGFNTDNHIYFAKSSITGGNTGILAWTNTATRTYTLKDASGTLAFTSDIPSLSGYIQGSGTTNYLPKFTGSTTIGNSQIFDNGTGVGIGTTSPQTVSSGFTLTVGDGATQQQPYLALSRNSLGGFWAGIRWYDGNTIKSVIQEDSDFNLRFSTSNAERLRITSGGNLLVGTTTDNGARLQVSGSATFSGASSRIRLTDTNITNPSFNTLLIEASAQNKFSLGVNSTSSQNYAITIDGITQNVGIGTSSPSNKLEVLGSAASPNLVGTNAYARFYQSGGYANVTIGALASGSFAGWIQTSDGVGTALPLSLQPSGGNLLVGTTTDNGARLQVSGTATFSSGVTATELTLNKGASDTIGAGSYVYYSNVGGTRGAVHQLNAAFGLDTFTFDGSTWSRRMTVTNSGNVGIGTASISNPISFIRVLNISGGDAGLIFSNTNGTAKNWSIGAIDSGSFVFFDGASERMRITSSGLLGIGTNNPTRSVQITRASTAFINAEGSIVAIGSSDTELRLFGNNTETMTLKSGNVGIGTSTPRTLLDVFANSDIWHTFIGGSTSKLLIGGQAGSGSVVLQAGNATTPNNAFPTTTYPLLLQRDGGNVLIGTTTDVGARLHVNGDVRTAAPTGGSAVNWRLGTVRGGTVTPNATVRVEIGGVLVDLDARYV